ncbi:MAG: hypothetical protein LVS60_07140 [Nodosilinea sp. LVE1205-7]
MVTLGYRVGHQVGGAIGGSICPGHRSAWSRPYPGDPTPISPGVDYYRIPTYSHPTAR